MIGTYVVRFSLLSIILQTTWILVIAEDGIEVEARGGNIMHNNENARREMWGDRFFKKKYDDDIRLVPHILSTSPRVMYYENFLTDEESDYFKNKAPQLQGWDDSINYTSVYFNDNAIHTDKIVNRIEWRIAGLTGIMPHYDQEALCIHRIKPQPDVMARVDNIHHDKANKPYTTVTVLMYLADTELGGETVFPCNLNKSTVHLCKRSFEGKARWHNGIRTVVEGVVHYSGNNNNGKKSKVEKEMKKLKEITSNFCAATKDNPARTTFNNVNNSEQNKFIDNVVISGNGGLKVKPKKGSAIMFWHDYPGHSGIGVGDYLAWHAGCQPYIGEKWTMQKFSEVPMSTRTEMHMKQQRDRQAQSQHHQQQKKKRKHRSKKKN